MGEGTLTLSCPWTIALRELILDIVPSVSEQFSTSITRTPIVTFKADQAFAFDTGTTGEFSFTIIRTQNPNWQPVWDNPTNEHYADSRNWSNALFERMIVGYIDRWQAETDGCKLKFEPKSLVKTINQVDHYIVEENVYLSNLTIRYDKGIPDTMYINLSATVGTMTAQTVISIPEGPGSTGYTKEVLEKDALVTMTSSDSFDHYVLYYGLQTEWSCVSSYTVKCGPENPFPILTLNLSKKNLSAVAPNLVEDIIPGKNRVFINGIGGGEYIVTKTASSGQNYKITAYSIYEQYAASPIKEDMVFGTANNTEFKSPSQIISKILTDYSNYGAEETKIFFTVDKIIQCYKTENDNWLSTRGTFKATTDAWYVLNVCALKLGCKIWFADNKAFIVDTSAPYPIPTNTYTCNCEFQQISELYVNMDLYEPEDQSEDGPNEDKIKFARSVCGETELGSEGSDVLKNYTIVTYGPNRYTTTGSQTPLAQITKSIDKFGRRNEEYYIPEISEEDAIAIADNTNERYCDSEQSIGFKLAETRFSGTQSRDYKYWQPYFSQLARVDTIYDYSKDLVISNKPNFTGDNIPSKLYGKLTLSTAEYFYPQGYTEYWFGIVCPTDLTQNTSVINNIIYNG